MRTLAFAAVLLMISPAAAHRLCEEADIAHDAKEMGWVSPDDAERMAEALRRLNAELADSRGQVEKLQLELIKCRSEQRSLDSAIKPN